MGYSTSMMNMARPNPNLTYAKPVNLMGRNTVAPTPAPVRSSAPRPTPPKLNAPRITPPANRAAPAMPVAGSVAPQPMPSAQPIPAAQPIQAPVVQSPVVQAPQVAQAQIQPAVMPPDLVQGPVSPIMGSPTDPDANTLVSADQNTTNVPMPPQAAPNVGIMPMAGKGAMGAIPSVMFPGIEGAW